MTDRVRLDGLLVDRGHYGTRSRARDAIRRGCVRVDGRLQIKPGNPVSKDCLIDIADPIQRYVSRAARKLIAGLDHFGFSPRDEIALDLGASTGGFCQVLLERGASQVIAVDVGHGQMAPEIATDPRIVNLEGLNARDLEADHLPGTPSCVTCDVSFISLKLALPRSLELITSPGWGLFLVKPQFEVGRDGLGKGGLVRDETQARKAAEDIAFWLDGQARWTVKDLIPSPITGGDGNTEYLLGANCE